MSKIDELIKRLCPNGVALIPMKDVSEIKRGDRITKKDITSDGDYIVMSGGVNPMGRYSNKNRNANTITISSYGAAGYVNYIEEDFWANDVCLSVFPNEEVLNKKYLYPNYSRISGIAYENGYVRENSSKTDTLQSFPPNKGALLPWGSDNF